MRVTRGVSFRFSVKHHKHQSKHVERRQNRHEYANAEQNIIMLAERLTKNGVLTIESTQQRASRERQCAYHERPEGCTHFFPQRSHVPNVLLVMHSNDHGSGSEKQQRFEKCVRGEMV